MDYEVSTEVSMGYAVGASRFVGISHLTRLSLIVTSSTGASYSDIVATIPSPEQSNGARILPPGGGESASQDGDGHESGIASRDQESERRGYCISWWSGRTRGGEEGEKGEGENLSTTRGR